MTHRIFQVIILLLLGASLAQANPNEVKREQYVDLIKNAVLQDYSITICNPSFGLSCAEQAQLLMLSLHQLAAEGFAEVSINAAQRIDSNKLPQRERLSLRQLLVGKTEFLSFASQNISPATEQQIKDLYFAHLDLTNFRNGEYAAVPKIYLFCRYNRVFPCRAVIRDQYNRPVLNSDGELRSFKMLAFSRHQKKFNEFSGNTPAGVFLIDGVMPEANKQLWYGKFRRLILEFVPKSKSEKLQKLFLPPSSHQASWWHEALIARQMGRSLFRIHGTGHINRNRLSPHYGFYGTSGCVQTRENEYDGVVYRDQQELLDELMAALEMEPIFANEPFIKAVLYVINIDDLNAPVEREDLARLGIL